MDKIGTGLFLAGKKIFAFLAAKKFFFMALILFLLLFGATYKNSLNGPWERDEGEYAYAAWLLDQGKMPYADSFMQKPPLIIYTYWLAYKINPEALWPPRLLALVFIFFTILLAGYIAKKEFGKKAGYFVIWILVPMLALPHLTPFAANTERFMLLPLLGVLAFYLNKEKSRKFIFGAGFLGTVSFLYKPVVFLILAFLMSFWFWEEYREKKNWRAVFSRLALFSAGVLTALVIFLGYFLWQDGGKALWECAFLFNKFYASQMDKYIPEAFIRYMTIFFQNWWILFIYTAAALASNFKRKWFYVGILGLGLLSVFSSPIGHYYFLIMPFWAILISASAAKISEAISINGKKGGWAILNMLIFITVMLMYLNIPQIFSLNPEENCLWIYGPNNPFIEAPIIAEKIKNHSDAGDKIFVAGSEPQIYYYSQRQSVSRFAITYPLIIETPVREKYQREAIAEISRDLPKLVVYSNREESGLYNQESPEFFINYLDDLLKNRYYLVGGYFWDNNLKGAWQNLPEDFAEKERASLLLYKIKAD